MDIQYIIATVKSLEGKAIAINAQSKERILQESDNLYTGETLHVSEGSSAVVSYTNGTEQSLQSNMTLVFDAASYEAGVINTASDHSADNSDYFMQPIDYEMTLPIINVAAVESETYERSLSDNINDDAFNLNFDQSEAISYSLTGTEVYDVLASSTGNDMLDANAPIINGFGAQDVINVADLFMLGDGEDNFKELSDFLQLGEGGTQPHFDLSSGEDGFATIATFNSLIIPGEATAVI